MIASISRQLRGSNGTRIPTTDSRSLQRGDGGVFLIADGFVELTQRPVVKNTLSAASIGLWLLLPLTCMLVDPHLQVPLISSLWLLMVFCLILCCSAKCTETGNRPSMGERRRPPRLSEMWPGTYQETKMLLLLLGLCCSVACILALARGGAFMLSALRSRSENHCSVAHLKSFFSEGLGAFRCQDGSLDAEHEGTVLLRHGWSGDAVKVYRMAPVYLREDALPVAWAVAKDRPLAGASCGTRGLCGLFLRPEADEAELLKKLAKELSHTLGFSKENDFHLQSMPLVALTDPGNPFGSKEMLSWAAVFYILALLTLLGFQMEFHGAVASDYELLATKNPETDTEDKL